MYILAHAVNFQFPSGEGKRSKLLPAAAPFGSLVHFRLRVHNLCIYTFHATFDVHYTPPLRYDAMIELKINPSQSSTTGVR